MNSKVVENYKEGEFENGGLTGAIKSKSGRRSVLFPLLLSILAAVIFWLWVVAENNTCSGVGIQVKGNEQLMSYNYTVASVEPSNIDIVLRGKSDVIGEILSDKSLISASVNVFGEAGATEGSYLFNSVADIKTGEYTIDVQVMLPDGVSCSTKSVKVTVARTYSKEIQNNDFKIFLTKYSFGNGFSIANQFVKEKSLTVSGDEETVSRISYIGLNVDWLKEVTDDVEAVIKPVAYDSFGGKIDSDFLRFEPAQLTVGITVNKSKNFSLGLLLPDNDIGLYKLSVETVRLVGPVALIDKINETILLNEDQNFDDEPLIAENYTLDVTRFGGSVKIQGAGGLGKTIEVHVERTEGLREEELVIPASSFKIVLPEGKRCTVDAEELKIRVKYKSENGDALTYADLVVLLDLSALPNGEHSVFPVLSVKATGKFGFVDFSRDTENVKVKISDISVESESRTVKV